MHVVQPICLVAHRNDDAWWWHKRFGKEKLVLMHDDLHCSITSGNPRGQCYFLIIINDVSCYMWVVLVDAKSTTLDTIKLLQRGAFTSFKCYTRQQRLVHGVEFVAYCDEWIQHHYCIPTLSTS